jgi:hypothetical protein
LTRAAPDKRCGKDIQARGLDTSKADPPSQPVKSLSSNEERQSHASRNMDFATIGAPICADNRHRSPGDLCSLAPDKQNSLENDRNEQNIMKKISPSTFSMSRFLGVGLTLVLLSAPAIAASLKSIMSSMGDNTSAAKAVLVNFDGPTALQILHRYSDDARRADAAFASSSSAKGKDLHARFSKLAAMADQASQKTPDAASFHQTMGAIVAECKSCHSVYN